MPFPEGWPPRTGSGRKSIRFYQTGTATADFADNGYLFVDGTGANTYIPLPVVPPGSSAAVDVSAPPIGTGENDVGAPKAMIFANTISIHNTGGTNALEFSFDGTDVHGTVPANTHRIYRNRLEAGIAIRSASGTTFVVEAW
jgi:hypothetical protein